MIALAARCLEAAGLHRFQVDVGHAEFFQGIMDAVKLPDAIKAGVREALAARDFVALEELLERTSLRSAEAGRVFNQRVGPERKSDRGELERARDRVQQAHEGVCERQALAVRAEAEVLGRQLVEGGFRSGE